MIGDDLRTALGLPLVTPASVKPTIRVYGPLPYARNRHNPATHVAYIYRHRTPGKWIVRWYYKGERKSKSWWINYPEYPEYVNNSVPPISWLRRRLERFNPTIYLQIN